MDFEDLSEVEQAILLSAFEDEIEKIAIYKQETYVRGTPAREGGRFGTPEGSGAWDIVGDRSGPQPSASKELTPTQKNLLALKKKVKAEKAAPKGGHIFGRAGRRVVRAVL